MIDIGIMIEGQNGLNWSKWKAIARAVDDLGFESLFRSDHYTNANAPDLDSLELWVSLTWLASHTKKIRFGPLVTPLSFRHPTFTARMGAAVDDLSGGRLTLGMGAGWQEREHDNYGWDLLTIEKRFQRFQEGLVIVKKLLESDTPIDNVGDFYTVSDAILLPRPSRPGGPPILVGGNGKLRTLPIAAKYAQEWNALFISPAKYQELNNHLNELLTKNKREPGEIKRSLMTGCVFGVDTAEVNRKVSKRTKGKLSAEELRERGLIVGTGPEIVSQLNDYAAVGLNGIYLQWLDLDDINGLHKLAESILPAFR